MEPKKESFDDMMKRIGKFLPKTDRIIFDHECEPYRTVKEKTYESRRSPFRDY